MGREEQKEEREVLDSIFPDEITDISDTEYRVSIILDVTDEDNDGEAAEPPTLLLHVSYPEAYPDEAPRLDISAPPNAPKHIHLDLQNDKAQLLGALDAAVEENLGMAMVFTLVSALKEAAEQIVTERAGAVRVEAEQEAAKREEEENRKFHGELVTRERFLAWRERFVAEMLEERRRDEEEKELEDKKKGRKEEIRITGRQLWERGLAGRVDEEDDGEDGLQGVEKLKIEA